MALKALRGAGVLGSSILSGPSPQARYSKRTIYLIAAATAGLLSVNARGQALPAGIYVERIGGSSDPTAAGSAVGDASTFEPTFIDSFAPNSSGGSAIPQLTISAPVADGSQGATSHELENLASDGSTTPYAPGGMGTSPNGRYLSFTGRDGANTVIGNLDTFSNSLDTSNIFNNGNFFPRSAVTPDGTNFYLTASNNGIRYITPSTSGGNATDTLITASSLNQRDVEIYQGQVFLDGGSSVGRSSTSLGNQGISALGAGSPTSGTNLQTYFIHSNSGTNNEQQYVLLDQVPGVGYSDATQGISTGLDTAYLASDSGLEKWTYNGSTWVQAYTSDLVDNSTIGATSKITKSLVGLVYAGQDSSGENVFYATTQGNDNNSGSAEGNALVKIVDTGSQATWSLISVSADNTWMRGLGVVDQTGDANGDFKVNSADFAVLAANYGKTGVTGGFAAGDFNYDGTVNALDFNALASNYGYNGGVSSSLPADSLGSVVPEPTAMAAVMFAALGLTRRRNRKGGVEKLA